MSEQEIIDRGMRAEDLMRDDNFNFFFELMQKEIGEDILSTTRAQKEVREDLYLVFDGFRSVIARLNHFRIEKDKLVNPELFNGDQFDDGDSTL